ncbi:3-hydroxybutyrate dehydrogenase [Rhodospirillaceae bacterium SYSU D60014]|uniref:3-hydroxybutyrate dehydrogenase n=1 Tax=Virgifigura deserti TaxID=2268457 RepID=UPI000E65EC9A
MTLRGKSAVVTGSTSGIGLGIATALARQGAAVMLNGFGEAGVIETIRDGLAERSGAPVGFHGADMTKPAEIADLMAAAADAHGPVDILVNNAGIQHVDPIERFPAERWDAVIAVNLSSAFHTIQAALPGMRAGGWGRIVNIASAHGLVASAQKSAYVAAKHGLIGLTKTVALEAAGSGVTCNAICPGWVLTPLVQRQIDNRARDQGLSVEAAERDLLAEKQPSGRFVTPEQLGEVTLFLCSEAASQMTGSSLSIDGGWTAQ